MKDFIFGTLATEELRYQHVRTRRAGVSHYQKRTPRDPLPGQAITLKLSVGPEHDCEQAWVYWTNDGSDPQGRRGSALNGFATPMQWMGVEWDTVLWGYIQHFQAEIPGQEPGTVLRYTLGAVGVDGGEIAADASTIYACYIADDPTPAWAQGAIVYQVFVDRFYPGKDREWLSPQTPAGFYGGTIKGIIEKLDYLCELGVNALWLTPIFPSPSHHGYDATDLFAIEPRLGEMADFQHLVAESHRRGLRILLDLVPNHVSNLHPAFQSASSSQDSHYRQWFTFTHWPDQYKSFFSVPELPKLNLREPAARQHMLDAARFWLDLGVDGYRLDYAIGPAPDFWADFRCVTRQTNPDCWTFGEVVEPPDAQLAFEGGLDGCLDFNLMEAFRQAFAYGQWNAARFAGFIIRHEAFFPETFSRPSFLDNHDMNRFLWAASGNQRRLRLAAFCQFTLKGPPVIYYGTEIGLSQLRDVRQDGRGLPEEARLPMLWGKDQNSGLLEYYRQLIRLRRSLTDFVQGKASFVHADKHVLVYGKENLDDYLVALNLSAEPQKVALPPARREIVLETGENEARCSDSEITLPPLGGVIIKKL